MSQSTRYTFLSRRGIIASQQQQISEHGGASGIREDGLLESTLVKAQTLLNYVPDSEVWDLAAAYGYGFIQNHVFVDGNKRIGLVAMAMFLYRNGYEIVSEETEQVATVLAVATGDYTQEDLSSWLKRSIKPLSRK